MCTSIETEETVAALVAVLVSEQHFMIHYLKPRCLKALIWNDIMTMIKNTGSIQPAGTIYGACNFELQSCVREL